MFAFVLTISYHNWFVYEKLYYRQLFTIIDYHLNAHTVACSYDMSYLITFDIWEVRIMSLYVYLHNISYIIYIFRIMKTPSQPMEV